jgi:hypothetical protein
MEQGRRFAEHRQDVPIEQYDRTQLFAFDYLTRMFGALKLTPPVVMAAIPYAITPKQVKCMVREYDRQGKPDYRPGFTLQTAGSMRV